MYIHTNWAKLNNGLAYVAIVISFKRTGYNFLVALNSQSHFHIHNFSIFFLFFACILGLFHLSLSSLKSCFFISVDLPIMCVRGTLYSCCRQPSYQFKIVILLTGIALKFDQNHTKKIGRKINCIINFAPNTIIARDQYVLLLSRSSALRSAFCLQQWETTAI